jgi:hypothetical protein
MDHKKSLAFIVGPEKSSKYYHVVLCQQANSSGNGFVLYDKFKQKSQERK